MIVGKVHRLLLTGVFGLLALISTVADAEEANTPTFKPPFVSEENSPYEFAVASDKKVMTLAFGGLTAILDGRADSPIFVARPFSVVLPLVGGERGIKVAIMIQGFVSREVGIGATLLSIANGQAHPMDFARLAPSQNGVFESEECGKLGERATNKPDASNKPAGDASSFMQCFVLDSPSAQDLRLTLFLLLDRQEKKREGQLHITALDASIEANSVSPKE